MLALSALVPACSSGGQEAGATGAGGQGAALSVVTSTNVYGDIVRQIAGDKASVTSIVSSPDADPHSFEADVRNQLALSRADIVVENGGGYDDFVDTMLRATKNSRLKLLNVVQISGRSAPAGEELNEHVWYDFPTVARLADQLVSALSAADPADASTFAANAAIFQQKLRQLEATEAAVKSA